jgi:hypothetical protein
MIARLSESSARKLRNHAGPRLAEALAYGDRYLEFRQRFDRIPGVQAAVWAAGEVRLSTAHGLARG